MLPVKHRGWGVGFLAAMGGIGSGAASLLYGVVEYLPGGWRALYIIASFPILYIAWLRRKLPESRIFDAHAARHVRQTFWEPLLEIFLSQRREMIAISLIASAFWFQLSATLTFMSKYLQEIHSYKPQEVSLLYIAAGTVAILGTTLAGRISDRIGRRPTLAVAITVNCAATVAFYNTGGAWLPVAWIAMLFSFFAADVLISAMSGELFTTQCRSTASTLRAICAMFAAVAGLAIEGTLFDVLGSHSAALSVLSLSSLFAVPVIVLVLRETSDTVLD